MVDEEYQEITLADLVNTIWRRKFILVAVLLVSVGAGIAVEAQKVPTYSASATVIPLEHPDIIKNFLDSRQAGIRVAEDTGDALASRIFRHAWDSDSQTWQGTRPSNESIGSALAGMVSIASASSRDNQGERMITVTATSTDPTLARDVADAFIDALTHLRPLFEQITIEQKFEVYYDGQNEQFARQRAEQVAKEKQYWVELDDAQTPGAPGNLNPMLTLALSIVLGLMLGVFAVFVVEWMSNYRAEQKRLAMPQDRRR